MVTTKNSAQNKVLKEVTRFAQAMILTIETSHPVIQFQ